MIITNDIFTTVDPEKKIRIINAALKEFALHGYKGASTNRIVEAAGIGKGMLFYYFNSKLELFQFLVEYTIESMKKYFLKLEDPAYGGDYIERYRIASKIKLEAYIENPHVFDFVTRLYLNQDEAYVESGIEKGYEQIEQLRNKYFDSLNVKRDTTLFRTDIPVERMLNYIKWLMDGYTQDIISGFNLQGLISDMDLSDYLKKFNECIDDMKLLFYERGSPK